MACGGTKAMGLNWFNLFFSGLVMANTCDLSHIKINSRYPHFQASGYWLQSAGDKYVTSTSLTGVGTYIFDLFSQQAWHIKDQDDFDIFGLPQGDLYILPNPIRFYAFNHLLKDKQHGQALLRDPMMMGFYQSLGVVNQSKNQRRVRVLTAQGAGLVRDYEVTGFGIEAKIKPLGIAQDLCLNLEREKLDFTIPILSRDGSMMAIRSYDSNDLHVYNLKWPSGYCQSKIRLVGATGKVNFSFDNQWVAYLRQMPEDPENKSLYVYSLIDGKNYRISTPMEKVGYMSFNPNGQLMYTREVTANFFELVFIDLSFLSQPLSFSPNDIRKWYQQCSLNFQNLEVSEFYFLLRIKSLPF